MKYLLFLLIGLVLVGCSDEKYVKGGHYIQGTETEENFRSALHGNFLLVDSLVPVDLKITVVDDQLDSLMSVKALVLKTSEGSYIYKAEPADYPSRYLKFSFTCLHSDSAFKMEFVQYVDYASDSVPVLNVLEALESERVESLVRKEKFYLEQAKIKALREVYRMLDCDSLLKGISYQDSPRTLWWLPYLYGKYDVRSSDSVFYAVYAKLRSAVGSEKTWHDYADETEIVAISRIRKTDKTIHLMYFLFFMNCSPAISFFPVTEPAVHFFQIVVKNKISCRLKLHINPLFFFCICFLYVIMIGTKIRKTFNHLTAQAAYKSLIPLYITLHI